MAKRTMRTNLERLALVGTLFASGCGAEPAVPTDSGITTGASEEAPSVITETLDPVPVTTLEPAPEAAYPAIADLPALSEESTKDERGLGYLTIGESKIRDGVYLLTLKSGGGDLEILMSLEARANGFSLIRGDRRNPRTTLRWIADDGEVEVALDGPGDPIAGRGKPAGDDWIEGTYRSENRAGIVTDGTFVLRKHYDPKQAAD